MNILVFVKQVPNTDDVQLDPKTGNLKREGVTSTINPLDDNAIETALQLREKHGGTVTAISMGPPQAATVLRKALGMGCDEAYLLSDRAFGGADTLATGYTLSKAAEKIGNYDLLIFGRHATDAETAQTGPVVAGFLGIPQVTFATSVDVRDGWAYCDRQLENSVQKVRVKLPAVVAVSQEINEPRYPNIITIIRKKITAVWNADDIGCDKEQCGGKGSPSSTKRVFAPPKRSTDTVYATGNPDEMAVRFVDLLQTEHLI